MENPLLLTGNPTSAAEIPPVSIHLQIPPKTKLGNIN
jgi:hypothetical protein